MRALALLGFLAGAAPAAEVAGVMFPESRRVGTVELALNGAGVREYGFFGLDVYAAGLYLARTQREARAVLDDPGPKLLVMHLFHGATARDAFAAWVPYFGANCQAPCVLPQAQIEAFGTLFPRTQKGDVQTYLFHGDAVTITHNGRELGRVEGAGFARLLLSTWIGEAPTTAELKRDLIEGRPG